MKVFVFLAVLVAAASASSHHRVRRANGDQQPKVWDALARLRGKAPLESEEIQQLVANAQAGQDYPTLSEIPAVNIDCASFKQPGFYADQNNRFQVFHRCDVNGNLTSCLCPNMTLFNQITLICDAFYNVDCGQSGQFQDHSNSRLYQEGADEIAVQQTTVAVQSQSGNTSSRSSSSSKSQQQARSETSETSESVDAAPASDASDPIKKDQVKKRR
ncbi:hypothetical protein RvY_14785 [Ramazzottius varieornatus]|uniref:Chitin-binding type-2 domain-containing protein n=1 Tax=Ramazzottius varieornatus TaxID=947166 RepID=A0A1D1VUB7_RAMVA|nr:hypothetical protein RvY_14785 [Ramazzottius varieornatus]